MSKSLLVIDDDRAVAQIVRDFLIRREWQVTVARDGLEGLGVCERERPEVILLDVNMPGISGLDVLDVLYERDTDASVVMLTGNADVATAVSAMRAGAENFLTKPVDFDHLLAVVERAHEKATLRRRARHLSQQQNYGVRLSSLERSPAMRELAQQVMLLASGSAPLLLTGETGTGKGWLAHTIHAASPRSAGPFVSINCAGLNATFLDTELFGHERGAFTDAKQEKEGLFEVADGGTLFLDEIGDLAPELQPKLLTVIETNRFRRLGGTKEREVDVRLVAATHHDLAAAVKAGKFREDLYYRLAVLPVRLPPLRERGDDEVAALAADLLADLSRKMGRTPPTLSVDSIAILLEYNWPGNIRELRNVLERALLLAGSATTLAPRHFPPELQRRESVRRVGRVEADQTLEGAIRRHIERVVEQHSGNRSHAARVLGIPRSTLYKRLREYQA